MALRRLGPSRAERMAATTVLLVLAAVTVWLGIVQSRLSPAVLVAMSPPLPVVPAASPGKAFATAAFLDDVTGATAAGPVESYDPETLSDRIDGKAELYLAANFKEMSVRSFRLGNGARLDVYVYAQASPQDAYAVLSSQRRSGAKPSSLSPDAYATENALYFTKGEHYLELAADHADDATRQALAEAGKALFDRLPSSAMGGEEAQRDPKTLFPTEGMEAASLRLAASDAMGMAGFSNVYTVDYVLPSGAATAFLAVRDTPAAAASDAEAFAGFLLQNGYARDNVPGLPQGAILLAAPDSFEVIWTRGGLLVGVHDAVTRQAVLDLAGKLDAGFKDGAP